MKSILLLLILIFSAGASTDFVETPKLNGTPNALLPFSLSVSQVDSGNTAGLYDYILFSIGIDVTTTGRSLGVDIDIYNADTSLYVTTLYLGVFTNMTNLGQQTFTGQIPADLLYPLYLAANVNFIFNFWEEDAVDYFSLGSETWSFYFDSGLYELPGVYIDVNSIQLLNYDDDTGTYPTCTGCIDTFIVAIDVYQNRTGESSLSSYIYDPTTYNYYYQIGENMTGNIVTGRYTHYMFIPVYDMGKAPAAFSAELRMTGYFYDVNYNFVDLTPVELVWTITIDPLALEVISLTGSFDQIVEVDNDGDGKIESITTIVSLNSSATRLYDLQFYAYFGVEFIWKENIQLVLGPTATTLNVSFPVTQITSGLPNGSLFDLWLDFEMNMNHFNLTQYDYINLGQKAVVNTNFDDPPIMFQSLEFIGMYNPTALGGDQSTGFDYLEVRLNVSVQQAVFLDLSFASYTDGYVYSLFFGSYFDNIPQGNFSISWYLDGRDVYNLLYQGNVVTDINAGYNMSGMFYYTPTVSFNNYLDTYTFNPNGVRGTNPTSPTSPTNSTTPTSPTNSSTPTSPTSPTNSTTPTSPTSPTNSTTPTSPVTNQTSSPSNSTNASNDTGPAGPAAPTLPAPAPSIIVTLSSFAAMALIIFKRRKLALK